jgi:hypothetical protein
LILAGIVLGYGSIHSSLEAERTLHAYYYVLDLLGAYLRERHGAWPKSWDDLGPATPSVENAAFQWPRDRADIEGRVFVDFSITAADVAKMDVGNFTAVKPIGPNYGQRDGRIRQLIDLTRHELADTNELSVP